MSTMSIEQASDIFMFHETKIYMTENQIYQKITTTKNLCIRIYKLENAGIGERIEFWKLCTELTFCLFDQCLFFVL